MKYLISSIYRSPPTAQPPTDATTYDPSTYAITVDPPTSVQEDQPSGIDSNLPITGQNTLFIT